MISIQYSRMNFSKNFKLKKNILQGKNLTNVMFVIEHYDNGT